MPRPPEHMWLFGEGCEVARDAEAAVVPLGYHVAFGGGCFHRGFSNKDLDLIVYPHTTEAVNQPHEVVMTAIGIKDVKKCDFQEYDRKNVYTGTLKGRRIDCLFLS